VSYGATHGIGLRKETKKTVLQGILVYKKTQRIDLNYKNCITLRILFKKTKRIDLNLNRITYHIDLKRIDLNLNHITLRILFKETKITSHYVSFLKSHKLKKTQRIDLN